MFFYKKFYYQSLRKKWLNSAVKKIFSKFPKTKICKIGVCVTKNHKNIQFWTNTWTVSYHHLIFGRRRKNDFWIFTPILGQKRPKMRILIFFFSKSREVYKCNQSRFRIKNYFFHNVRPLRKWKKKFTQKKLQVKHIWTN